MAGFAMLWGLEPIACCRAIRGLKGRCMGEDEVGQVGHCGTNNASLGSQQLGGRGRIGTGKSSSAPQSVNLEDSQDYVTTVNYKRTNTLSSPFLLFPGYLLGLWVSS